MLGYLGPAAVELAVAIRTLEVAPDGSARLGVGGGVTVDSTPGNGLPSDYQFVAGDNGVHSFTGVSLKTAGTQSITATDVVTPSERLRRLNRG